MATTGPIAELLAAKAADWEGAHEVYGAVVATALARTAFIFGDVSLHVFNRFTYGALLRKNLFSSILDRPGARAVPGPSAPIAFSARRRQATPRMSATRGSSGTSSTQPATPRLGS